MILEYFTCFLLALLLLTVPLKWMISAAVAALVHEIGHAAVIWLLGHRIMRLRFGPFGACMETDITSRGKELLAAAAGPAASLLLLLTGSVFPRVALCGAVQGIYNLLPIYPLDGGRIVYGILAGLLGEKWGARLGRTIEIAVLILLFLTAVFLSIVLHMGILPILVGIILAGRSMNRKIPCKPNQLRVQ